MTTCEMPRASDNFATRLEALTCLRGVCLASLQVLSDKCAELVTFAGSGPQPSEWFARLDPASQSLRTRQASLFSKMDGPGTELCQDWRRAGMICGGMYFPLPPLVPGISASASFLLLPTPTGRDWKDTPGMSREVVQGGDVVRSREDQLARRIYAEEFRRKGVMYGGLRLTPEFLCWLMGFPTDWLKPLRDALGTRLSRKSSSPSQEQSGKG